MSAHDIDLHRVPARRELPNNIEAEQAMLGAIMVNNDAFYRVSDIVDASHFFDPLHRRIFELASDLIRTGKRANPVTMKSFLPADEKVGDITVSHYLARLVAGAVTIVSAPDYAGAVRDMATRRAQIAIAQDLMDQAFDTAADTSPAQVADATIDRLAEASVSPGSQTGSMSMGEALTAAIDAAGAAYQQDGSAQGGGIEHDVSPLNRLIGALYGGQLIVLGGATKQGKSALAGQIANGVAARGVPVWFYSGEMTPRELAMREISRRVGVPVRKQKRGEVSESQFEQMMALRKTVGAYPITIQDRRLTLPQLRERCQRVTRKKGQTVIIVDHIGLLERDRATRNMSAWEFGEEITRELKVLARELDCPVIACSQLKKNTFAENKGPVTEVLLNQIVSRKPRYADLIGGIERDADHVIVPFRPEVFLMEHEPTIGTPLYGIWECKVNEWRGKAQLVLALSRELHWPASVNVGWDGPKTTFFETGAQGESETHAAFADNPMRLF